MTDSAWRPSHDGETLIYTDTGGRAVISWEDVRDEMSDPGLPHCVRTEFVSSAWDELVADLTLVDRCIALSRCVGSDDGEALEEIIRLLQTRALS